jgi:hypothetical protein
MRELSIVSESFVKVLTGIHHHRIAYPGYDFDRTGREADLPGSSPEREAAAQEAGLSGPTTVAEARVD